jgi:RNA polymerase sigma-70 factor (ECF subfamily)
MSSDLPPERLSQISTAWSLFRQAHGGSQQESAARRVLVERYYAAAYRYLLGAVRNEDSARELFQEFAMRMMRGDFHRATPDRGRLRDYLKTSLRNLVNDHWAACRAKPRPLPDSLAAGDTDSAEPSFEESLRQELLQHAWDALKQSNENYYVLLLAHVETPLSTAAELAEEVGRRTGKSLNAAQVRVTLHRARHKLATLLLDELAAMSPEWNRDELLAELESLRLAEICRTALDERL